MRLRGSLVLALVGFVDFASASLLDQIRMFVQNGTFLHSSQTDSQETTPCPSSNNYLYTCPPGFSYPGACHDVEAIPEGSQCNKKGDFLSGDFLSGDGWGIIYNGMPQENIQDCAFICHGWSTCNSYGWNSLDPDTPCRFYEKGLAEGGFLEEPVSPASWYDVGCANCTRCGTEPPYIVPGLPPSGSQCTLSKSIDPQYHCNEAGTVKAGARFYDVMIYPHTVDAGNCATICSKRSGCRASGYNFTHDRYQCLFSGYSLKDANFQKSSEGQIWSDKACWECTSDVDEA